MKKRSLVAAIAMMLVSAILLTGSTYAWFITGKSANVGNVAAKVKADDQSSVQVATNVSDPVWVTSLDASSFNKSGQNPVPVLNYDPKTNAAVAYVADFDGSNFTVSEASSSLFNSMLTYSFKVRAVGGTSSQSIRIPVSFEAGALTPAICGAITIDDATTASYIYGPGGGYDMIDTVTSAIDGGSTKKGVIDVTNDTILPNTVESLTHITPDTADHIDIADASRVHTVYVTVWAEGQVPTCTGNVDLTNCGFTFGTSSNPITLV